MTAVATSIIPPIVTTMKIALADWCEPYATRGIAPAGGCVRRRRDIPAITHPTPIAADHQTSGSRLADKNTMSEAIAYPPITLAGWANGLLGWPNNRTAVAPNGAISSGNPVSTVRAPTISIATTAPSPDFK